MSSKQAACLKESPDRTQVIAHAWYQALAGTAFVPYRAREISDRLVQLVEQAIALLHAETFSPAEAQSIGAALVDLRYIQGKSLGVSVELLASELPAGLPPDQLPGLQPRLAILLGGITQGFFQQASMVMLAEQESIRQADVETLRALHTDRERQKKNLLEAHERLKTQIKERARIEEALRLSEEQFRILFEESPVALWVHDGSQLYSYLVSLKEAGIQDIRSHCMHHPEELQRCAQLMIPIDVNQQAVKATGVVDKKDLLHLASEQIDPAAGDLLLNQVVDIANNKTYGTGTISTVTPEGRTFATVYQWSVPVGYETTYARIILSFIDITAQKEAEQELLRTAERLEALHNIESGILQAESPHAIAEVALEHLERIIPSQMSAVTLFRSSHSEDIMLAGRNSPLKPGDAVHASRDQVETQKQGQAIVINDLAALPNNSVELQPVLKLGGRALLSVPLLAQGDLIGSLTLINTNPNTFSEQDVRITQQVGNSVAIAINNARLLEKEKNARREAETLREVAASINASLEQKELLGLILTQLKRVLHFDSASILLYQQGSLGVIAHQGILVQAIEAYEQAEHLPPILIKLALEKRPQIISDTRDDPEWVVYPGGESICCWLGIPLMVKEKLIGMLMLDNSEPNYYTAQDSAVALAFANHAAVAIENSKLYRESQQYAEKLENRVAERTRELGALYEITAVSSQHLELQETFERVISVIDEALECRTIVIQILDESSTTLHLASHKNLSPPMVEYMREIPGDNCAIREVLEGREATIFTNPPSDPRMTNVPIPGAVTYGIGAPIRSKGRALGILGISIDRPHTPTREDLALITSIADHIGVAVENARLRQQSEQLAVLEERERLARDLHDSATQSLFSLTLFAAAARENLSSGQLESVQKQLVELEETAAQTHKEMRLLLYQLRSTVLEEEGLVKALQRRMQMVEVRSGIRGHINAKLSSKLPVAVEQVLFQVANEALNNTLKHSGADTVTINITTDNSHVSMKIKDNGQGFAAEDAKFDAGMGMDNMRQRVREMGGTFNYESQPNSGTTIVVHIPIVPVSSPGDD